MKIVDCSSNNLGELFYLMLKNTSNSLALLTIISLYGFVARSFVIIRSYNRKFGVGGQLKDIIAP